MSIFDSILRGKHLPILEGVDSVIGEGAKIKGELTTKGSVSINGEFEGKVLADKEVIVGAAGKVTGEIRGGSVVVSGKVEGNITALNNLEIARMGRVHGDITGGKIVIDEGSSYQGKVSVISAETKEIPEEEEKTPKEEKSTFPTEYSQPQIFPEV